MQNCLMLFQGRQSTNIADKQMQFLPKHVFIDKHVLMSAVQARLEDVISYSDFSQEVPIQKILVQDLLENRPEDNLLEDLLSGDTPINETDVHVVSSGKFDKNLMVTIYYLKLEQECVIDFSCIFFRNY